MQPSAPNKSSTEIIIITHGASKAAMNKVLKAFESLAAVRKIKSVYRVEG
jgi:homoserine dehydrogenase